jgi:flagellin-like protein
LEQRAVSPVIGTILLIAITVALAAVVATLVGGLSVRGAPQNALLKVTAAEGTSSNPNDNTHYRIIIEHEGGDDLVVKDMQIMASDSATTMATYSFPGTKPLFSVGDNDVVLTCSYTPDVTNKVVSVYIIHKPSRQKIFSAKYVTVN